MGLGAAVQGSPVHTEPQVGVPKAPGGDGWQGRDLGPGTSAPEARRRVAGQVNRGGAPRPRRPRGPARAAHRLTAGGLTPTALAWGR